MFDIVEFVSRIFKKDKHEESRVRAKERLKLVLVSDRASVSPQVMEDLREELIQVISRYMTIDTSAVVIELERRENSVALAANVPIINVRRNMKKDSASSAKQPAQKQPKSAAQDVVISGELPESEEDKSGLLRNLYGVVKESQKELDRKEAEPAKTEEKAVQKTRTAPKAEEAKAEAVKDAPADESAKGEAHHEGCTCPECLENADARHRRKGRRVVRKQPGPARGKSLRKRVDS